MVAVVAGEIQAGVGSAGAEVEAKKQAALKAGSKGEFTPFWTIEDAVHALRNQALNSQDPRWADRGKAFQVWEQQRKWTNPLVTPLPHAPSLKIVALYGVGLRTERSYVVSTAAAANQPADETLAAGDAVPWLIDRFFFFFFLPKKKM
ncbi:hypothetical protein T492DRAFT_426176 [Pavlovales sp. CCMP2436]|nr:hypothetical protein T492DRAFT_426176 [Pavlovales sp. CCMP2436]